MSKLPWKESKDRLATESLQHGWRQRLGCWREGYRQGQGWCCHWREGYKQEQGRCCRREGYGQGRCCWREGRGRGWGRVVDGVIEAVQAKGRVIVEATDRGIVEAMDRGIVIGKKGKKGTSGGRVIGANSKVVQGSSFQSSFPEVKARTMMSEIYSQPLKEQGHKA